MRHGTGRRLENVLNSPGKFMIISGNKVLFDNLPTLKSAIKKAHELEWMAYDSHQYLIVQVIADAKKI